VGIDELRAVLNGRDWRKCVLRAGGDKVTASPVVLKRGPAVKLVESRGGREETSTVPDEDWPARLDDLLLAADRAHLLGADQDWHARRTKRGRWLVSRGKPSAPAAPVAAAHDRAPQHALSVTDPLFAATGLVSPEGRVRKPHAAKYRQVQHYLELLRPLPVWREGRPVRVVDAGCGKAYLSLALVAWARARGLDVELTGVDANPDVVATVGGIARELGYDAAFETASIWDYARTRTEPVDLLVSLHACDTASDEALAAGVVLGAEAIVLAPCCHHELAGQLRQADAEGLDAVFRHGLFRSRLADLVTDALRSAALEAFGYKADAIEFVAAEHTAKNVMIRAVRRPAGRARDRAAAEGLRAYDDLAGRFGAEPTLRRLLADRWPAPRAAA
jgi:SAM-dependent methyltransferase